MDNQELFLDYLEESFSISQDFEKRLLSFHVEKQKHNVIQSLYRNLHTLKASTGSFGFSNFESVLHKSENFFNDLQKQTDLENILDQSEANNILDLLFSLSDFIKKSLKFIETNKVDIEANDQEILGEIEKLFQKHCCVNPKIHEKHKIEKPQNKLEALRQKALKKLKSKEEVQISEIELDDNMMIKLSTLDKLSSLSSELILARNVMGLQVNQFENNNLQESFYKLDTLVRALSERISKVRLQPLSVITDKLKRLVRDLSKSLDKEIEFITIGDKIEIDRSILEYLKDSFIHLIRNSIDHGIESKENRLKLNKDPKGTITLKTSYKENYISIEISDDGRGLDLEKIKQKAIEKSLISTEEFANLDDDKLMNLIFHPNFSTKDEVSTISGRGVGMDVIMQSVKKCNGSIDIKSVQNQGTTFIINLPLTLAITNALLVKVKDNYYAIPSNFIQELLFIEAEKLISKKEIIVREEVYEIIFASKVFEHRYSVDKEYYCQFTELSCVLINLGDIKFLFVVDEVLDLQSIVIKPLPQGLEELTYCSGVTLLADASVAQVIEMSKLYKFINQVEYSSLKLFSKKKGYKNKVTSHHNKLLSFRLGQFLFGINKELVQEVAYKKNFSILAHNSSKSLIKVRDQILLGKKINSTFKIPDSKSVDKVFIIIEIHNQNFAIEVDDIGNYITIDKFIDVLKEPNPSLKGLYIQAYNLKDGQSIYVLDEEILLY